MSSNIYLVTGGAGFIGSHFVETVLAQEEAAEIIVLDNLSTGLKSNVPEDPRVELVLGDITDEPLLDKLFDRYDFNYIIHLAAVSSVQDSIKDPALTHKINMDATLSLLERSRNLKHLKRFVYSSSAAVYGDRPRLPSREDNPVNPLTPYGVDKYASERSVLNGNSLFGVPSTAFRFFNVYGPRQNPASPYSGVISIFAERILKGLKNVKIFGDGHQTRDFVYVKDLVDAVLYGMKLDETKGNVYNIGTGRGVSLLALLDVLRKITGERVEIEFLAGRKGDVRNSRADITGLRKSGYNKKFTPLLEGLTMLVQFLRAES